MEPTDALGGFNESPLANSALSVPNVADFASLTLPTQDLFAGAPPIFDRESLSTDLTSLGTDMGALMLYTSPELLGDEIHLISEDRDEPRRNGRVQERQLVDGVSFAAVYPYLPQGRYTIEGSNQRVSVTGGRVTTLEYRDGCCRIYYHPSPMSTFVDKSEL